MAKKKASRLGEAIRKRALSYPGTHEDFPWGESAFKVKGKKGWVTMRPTSKTSMEVLHFLIDEGFRAVAPKKIVAALPDPAKLPR